CALLVETTLSPWQVLRTALAIEKDLGRQRADETSMSSKTSISRTTRIYQSRPMDIDLIFYDDRVIDTPELTLPHPRMHLRRFVLEPLAEIMPEYRHPSIGKSVKELLSEL
ncbi:MAG: 2-amino-4-hydroxy-6-hydroxymethyldihydropteridine diphosphokinase, partial [Bacteroidales bacterium]|nr:2-amino-4-hydroxy-6-hydroxymethyldihydropteridine diphosphokinase [Bacteroidales bacterium]